MEGVFVIILAGMAVGAISEIAKAFARRGVPAAALTNLEQQVAELAAAVEEARGSSGRQAAEIAELQERLDFAERLLTQARERGALGPGSPQS